MIVKMVGLYGLEDVKAYFRKIGSGCFDFTTKKKFASDLSAEEAKIVVDKTYCLKI